MTPRATNRSNSKLRSLKNASGLGWKKTPTCWLWKGRIQKISGYGVIDVYGLKSPQAAHRIAWKMTNGAIPFGMYICHSCDVRACVRPGHLFLGTAKDNMTDMISKGRQDFPFSRNKPVGEKNPRALLTAAQVLEIRAANKTLTNEKLAELYGVSSQAIGQIRRRETWRHL
jgi:hypothetical protein